MKYFFVSFIKYSILLWGIMPQVCFRACALFFELSTAELFLQSQRGLKNQGLNIFVHEGQDPWYTRFIKQNVILLRIKRKLTELWVTYEAKIIYYLVPEKTQSLLILHKESKLSRYNGFLLQDIVIKPYSMQQHYVVKLGWWLLQ